MNRVTVPRTLDLKDRKGRIVVQFEAELVCSLRRTEDGPVAEVETVMIEGSDLLDCGDDQLEAIGRRIKTEAEADGDFHAQVVDAVDWPQE